MGLGMRIKTLTMVGAAAALAVGVAPLGASAGRGPVYEIDWDQVQGEITRCRGGHRPGGDVR